MDEIIRLVVQKVGIPEAVARQAVEMVLGQLMQNLPEPIRGQVSQLLPGFTAPAATDAAANDGGGIMGMLGGLLGGGGSASSPAAGSASGGGDLIGMLTDQVGLTQAQAQGTVDVTVNQVKEQLPDTISGQLDGLLDMAGSGDAENLLGKLGGLFGG